MAPKRDVGYEVAPPEGGTKCHGPSLRTRLPPAPTFPDRKQIPKADQNRAAGCLKGLGFQRRKSRVAGGSAWLWTKAEAAIGL
jgi:hypothetical protein